MKKETIKKIVLAYSGGLDTSIIIPWLKENYNNPEIIAVAADVGQGDELEGLEEKALKTGASKLIIADLVDEMCDEIIVPSIMMGAKYEKYLRLQDPSSARSLPRLRLPRARMPLPTAAPAKETIRSALSWQSSILRPACRSSRRGESGASSPETRKSTTPRHTMCR